MAGLRPAPERVEAEDPATYGVVMAQHPPAGATAARGAFVTLYVAAPPQQQSPSDADAQQDESIAQAGTAVAADAAEADEAPPPQPAETDDDLVLESPLADGDQLDQAPGEQLAAEASRPTRRARSRLVALATGIGAAIVVAFVAAAAHWRQPGLPAHPPDAQSTRRVPRVERDHRAADRTPRRKTHARRRHALTPVQPLPRITRHAAPQGTAGVSSPNRAADRPLPMRAPSRAPAPSRTPAVPDEFF